MIQLIGNKLHLSKYLYIHLDVHACMHEELVGYLDTVLKLGRRVFLNTLRKSKIYHKAQALSITITKKHGSGIRGQLSQDIKGTTGHCEMIHFY